MKITLTLALALLAPLTAHAAEDGTLWEVVSKMERSGASPMGERTMKLCKGEDPREEIKKDKDMRDCEIKDFKKTETTVSMSMLCKKGRSAKMEIVYNKARTEYKATMLVKQDDAESMTMRMTGKKLGVCDPKKAPAETADMDEMIKAHKARKASAKTEAADAEAAKKAAKDEAKAASKKAAKDAAVGALKGLFGR